MNLSNYCIIALGDVSGFKDIVRKISEISPRCLEQQGVFIGTFSSMFTIAELRDIFDGEKKTFFVFEVGNQEKSAYKIGKPDIHEQLFGYLNDIYNVADSGTTTQIKTEISDEIPLEEQLKIALEKEDYARAAELRDEINSTKERN